MISFDSFKYNYRAKEYDQIRKIYSISFQYEKKKVKNGRKLIGFLKLLKSFFSGTPSFFSDSARFIYFTLLLYLVSIKILVHCDNICIFVPEFSVRHFLIFMKILHPACYFDTVILIFCYLVPYLVYHFTS